MMTQDTLFDHARNERNGILDALAASRSSYLAGMRSIAREIAGRTGRVTVDDVSTAAKERGYPMPEDLLHVD